MYRVRPGHKVIRLGARTSGCQTRAVNLRRPRGWALVLSVCFVAFDVWWNILWWDGWQTFGIVGVAVPAIVVILCRLPP